MSKHGIIVAGQYAQDLPTFDNSYEAEQALFTQRDTGLCEIQTEVDSKTILDYSIESLQSLERWYFEKGQPQTTLSGYSIPHAIGFYFGEVLCRNLDFKWVVQEFAFAKGCFEIGVQRARLSIMLTKGKLLRLPGNKRMQSMWREARNHAA